MGEPLLISQIIEADPFGPTPIAMPQRKRGKLSRRDEVVEAVAQFGVFLGGTKVRTRHLTS